MQSFGICYQSLILFNWCILIININSSLFTHKINDYRSLFPNEMEITNLSTPVMKVENIMSNETVLAEKANGADCDAEVEVEAEDDNIQYHLYAVNRGDSTMMYKVLQVNDNNRVNNEFSIAAPMNNTVQVLTSPLNGQLYLLSNNSNIVTTTDSARAVAPRVAKLQIEGSQNIITSVKKRDERRRVTHNEVERRRRDKINNWISKLGKLLAECDQNVDKEGDAKANFESQSKGGILARACEYITELRETQEKLVESLDEKAQLIEEAKNLRQVVNQLRDENSKLKDQIEKRNVFMIST